ncbi:MAG: PAS domain S-box protein [Rubrivivax sp.]|nr:PAS domain S-box protein [Rubrivivax sp.]
MTADSELPPPEPEPVRVDGVVRGELQTLRVRLARAYLLCIGLLTAAFPLLYLVLQPQRADAPLGALAAVLAGLSALSMVALRLLPQRLELAVALVAVAAIGILGLAAGAMGWGVAAPGIGFVALHTAFAVTLLGPRAAWVVSGSAVAMVLVLAQGHAAGWLPPLVSRLPLALHAAVQVLLIGCAAGGGWVVSRVLQRFVVTAGERDHRFHSLLRIASDAYWELDPRNRLVAVSRQRPGAGAVIDAGIGGVPWEQPAFGCDPDTLDHLLADIDARQPFRDVAVQWQLPGAAPRHLLVSGEPRTDASGVFQGYWGVARDVTDHQRARQALAQTESRYHDLFASIPSPLVLHRDGRVIDANPAAVALFGYPDLSAMVGQDLLESYLPGASRERAVERMGRLQAMAPGDALPVAEFQLRARSGREHVVRATGVAVETARGTGVLSIYVDDTERQAAEDAVRRSEALLSHLVASSPDVITLTDVETGRFAMVNRTFERITGWAADEVIGRTAVEIGTWFDLADRDRFAQLLREQSRVQDVPIRFRRRDGQPVPMLVSGARFEMDRRDYLVVNARDMTELERSRLEREAILDNASLGIALTRDNRFQMVNPAFEAMLGWPDGSILGLPGNIVWPSTEAYAQVGQQIGPPLSRGEQIEIECEVRRGDGSTFLCRMLARAVDPSHPSRGGTIWVVEDITERRRLDEALARARDAAEAASRAKSAFLANTSHELRTPLNGLLGMAQLARTPGLDEARRAMYLEQIVDSAQSLAMVVSDILDLSKIEAGRLSIDTAVFDLAAMLRSLHRGYTTLAAARPLSLVLDLAADIGTVRGDALRVRQILTNYLSNALKFTEQGGVRLQVQRLAGDRVRFEVLDTGPGIDPATQARLFKPFTQADESTTRRFGGTGLGLSICRELATLMGGEVGVHSVPGQGSCFWAELPLPAASAPPGLPAPAFDPAATHGAHVLMVDDNEINMMVAVAQLEQFGVRVGQAVDGRQALDAVAAAESAGDPYDLVIMDLQMPVLSGYEVTRALRERYTPEQLPIVAHTAAALVSERENALAAGMNDFLPKPTDIEQLRVMVARWVLRQMLHRQP